MKWRQAVPSFITVLAMLAGFFSILFTIEGIGSDDPHAAGAMQRWAALMIMLSMILDGLDGNVARWLKGESEFGAELDTYVDLMSFGLAPAILIFSVSLHGQQVWRVVLPAAVALSGMVRLARFKVKDPLRGQGGYAGLPITANAGWVATLVFISQSPPMNTFSLNTGPVAILFLVGVFTFIVLQVTNLRYPKPTKKPALFIPSMILYALLFVPVLKVQMFAAIVLLALGVSYVLIGPLFVKGVEVHKARKEAKFNGARQDS